MTTRNRTYRTKLKVTSKKLHEALKKAAGHYRFIFNTAIEWQFYRTTMHTQFREDQLTSLNMLKECYKVFENKPENNFLKESETGLKMKALKDSNFSYKRWFYIRMGHNNVKRLIPGHISKKKQGMRFSISSPVKIFYDYIKIPRIGKVKLYERGYLPQGEGVKKASFEFDGSNWWVNIEIESKMTSQTPLVEHKMYADFNLDGSLVVDDKFFGNVIDSSKNYQKLKSLKKSLTKKYNRQKKSNRFSDGIKVKVRTSRNMMKTRNRIEKVSSKMERIKEDYFKKVSNAVAKTKPTELHLLGRQTVRKERLGYLTRKLRESSTKKFLEILTRKCKNQGTVVVRHLDSKEFYEALSSKVCGASQEYDGCRNWLAMKQELGSPKERKNAILGQKEPSKSKR